MTDALDRIADLPGVASVVQSRTTAQGAGRISADGHTAYATVTFDDHAEDIDKAEAQAVVRHRQGRRGRRAPGGARRQRRSRSPSRRAGTLAEIVGVAVAAVVLLPRLRLARRVAAAHRHRAGRASAPRTPAIVLLGHAMTVADFAPMLGMLIGLGVGIDYALFIVTRHRRGLKRGLSVAEAVTSAVATTGTRGGLRGCHRVHRPAGDADPPAELPQRRRDRRLPDRRPDGRRLRHPAARPAVLHRPARPEPPRAAPPGRARARSRSCRPGSPPAGRRSWSATPRCSARVAAGRHGRPRAAHALPPPGHLRPGQRPQAVHHPPGLRPARGTASGPASTAR